MNIKDELGKLRPEMLLLVLEGLTQVSPFTHECYRSAIINRDQAEARFKAANRSLTGATILLRSAMLKDWTSPQIRAAIERAHRKEVEAGAAGISPGGASC